ncbi:la-related protein 1B isoform X1 [Musa acuminata AAA Group]|uniref:la-related protein 1B isoform X1 n=1 Tax=Musa acuminata AAA Group TaxID=214697 RepID=UPI0031CF44AB
MSRASDPSSPDHAEGASPYGPPSSPAAASPPPEPSRRSSVPAEASGASASAPPTAENEEHGTGGNAAGDRGKRPAWNVPANGAIEVGPVMGADSWPALSASGSRASARSSSLDSLKVLAEGSSTAAPLGSMMNAYQLKLNANNTNPRSIPNYDVLAPQEPNPNPNLMKSDAISSSSSYNHGPGAPQRPSILSEMPPVGVDKGHESSPEGLASTGNSNSDQHKSDEFAPQLQRSSNRRRGGYSGNHRGNYSGGTGSSSHHGRYGTRHDHDRGGYDWNSPRGFSGRNPHRSIPLAQQWGQSRPFIRPPPPPPPPAMAQFLSMPPHIWPFVSPMGYPEIPPIYYLPPPPPDTLGSMPFITHQVSPVNPSAMFHPSVDHKSFMLVKQIEYYFSPDNLCKDSFLRRNMDDQGWVPISLIAGFNRVKQLTEDIPYILDAVQGSTVVEVQGEKIRRRGDWMRWTLSSIPHQYEIASSAQSPRTPDHDSVIAQMHAFGLEEGSSLHGTSQIHGNPLSMSQTHNEMPNSRSPSGSIDNQMQDAPAEDGNSQSSLQ